MPIAGLDVSSGARAGLTGFLAGIAREVADANVTINFLLPGSFDTDRLQSGQSLTAQASDRSIDEVRGTAAASIPAKRFGDPDELVRRAHSSPPIGPATSPARACSSTEAPTAASSRDRGWSVTSALPLRRSRVSPVWQGLCRKPDL